MRILAKSGHLKNLSSENKGGFLARGGVLGLFTLIPSPVVQTHYTVMINLVTATDEPLGTSIHTCLHLDKRFHSVFDKLTLFVS